MIFFKKYLKMSVLINEIHEPWIFGKNGATPTPPSILELKFTFGKVVVWDIDSYIFRGADHKYGLIFTIFAIQSFL